MLKQIIFKNLFVVVICLASSVTLFARDVITLRNGIDIHAVIYEVGEKEIVYRRVDNLHGSVFRLRKSEVFRVVFDNGTVIVFDQTATPTTTQVQRPTQPIQNVVLPQPEQQVIIHQPAEVEIEDVSRGREERIAVNFGAFMGGGGLIGFDFGGLISNRIGLQAGAGLPSFSIGLNYHLRPYINSSFFSLKFSQLGFGNNHIATTIGPGFDFRARRIFQAGIDFGYVVRKGPNFYNAFNEDTHILFNFRVGLFFPL